MSGYHVIVEGQTPLDESIAGNAARALCEAYPGHPWHVDVRGGLIIVKHMRLSGKWGQVGHSNGIYSASNLKEAVVKMGGEMLERAGMTRGKDAGERPLVVEGIPQKDRVIG